MTTATMIVVGASVVIMCASAVLWISHRYNDGVMGRAGLMGMMASAIILLCGTLLADVEYEFLPESILFRISTALFLVHHVVKVLRGWEGWWFMQGTGKDRREQQRGSAAA